MSRYSVLMTRQRPASGTTAVARFLGVVALSVGVLVMHIGLMAATHPEVPAGATMVVGSAHIPSDAPGKQIAAGHGHHSEIAAGMDHAMVHACVFILAGVAIVMGLVFVAWLGVTRLLSSSPGVRWLARRRNRAPPWTIHSPAELAILRI